MVLKAKFPVRSSTAERQEAVSVPTARYVPNEELTRATAS